VSVRLVEAWRRTGLKRRECDEAQDYRSHDLERE
jgi:hypothetical protein